MKRQNDRILKKELPRSVGAHYATGDQWRNNFRKNEGMQPKQKPYPASRGDGIPVELFQILKDDAVKVLHSIHTHTHTHTHIHTHTPANLENSAVATGVEKVSFHPNHKGNAKECSSTQLH